MFLTIVTFLVLLIAFGCVITLKSDRAMFYSGGFLISFGLIFSAFSIFFVETIFPESTDVAKNFRVNLMSNLYLIIAAIGANLFASAICSKPENQRHSFSLFRKRT